MLLIKQFDSSLQTFKRLYILLGPPLGISIASKLIGCRIN